MSLFSATIAQILKRVMRGRMRQIERFMNRPHDVQQTTLENLLEFSKNTEWGKKYGYTDIQNAEQFAQRVPISAYEDLFPYIERCMKGEQNVLWASNIDCFSKSSGTTNARSKFIPVSAEAFEHCHYKGGKDLLCLYLQNYPNSEAMLGKAIGVGGTYQQNHLNPETYYGDISALLMKNLPIWAEYLRTPTLEVALMDEWEEKIEKMAQMTAKENVTNFSGVPTWTIFLIKKVLEYTGKSSILEVWPNLEVFFHGAVAFGPYRKLFKELIPSSQMNYMEVYNASEGFFGMQDLKDSEEMLLMLDYGVYYEFIPMSEIDKENPKTIRLDEVQLDKNYALIITTNSGLWRYKIGDTVKFTSLAPYRIKISGRTKHFINAFGEEVIIENADLAIRTACEKTDAVMNDYTAAPVYIGKDSRGGHEWIIEFEKMPTDLQQFTEVLDTKLREVNSDYDAKRHREIALVEPVIHGVSKGTFYEWMKKRGKLGGQNKVPRLSNSREYVDDILKMLK